MLHVTGNTNDRHPFVGFVTSPVNTDSNWVLAGKKLPHEGLVDDRHPRLSFAVHRTEVASGANGDLHDSEVITYDRQSLHLWFGSHRRRLLSVDHDAMVHKISRQGKVADHRPLHPGKGVNPREQLTAEIRLQGNLRIAGSGQLKVHGDDVRRIESR